METTLRSPRYDRGPPMRWSVAAGLGLIIAGLITLAAPLVGLSAAVHVFGWAALFAGAIELTHAFEIRRERHAPWGMLAGALYVGAGFLLLFRPFEGRLDVALTIGALLCLRAVVLGAVSWQLRRTRVAVLYGLEAAVSLTLGVLALAGLPSRELQLVALYGACGLVVNGVNRLAAAALLRSQYQTPTTGVVTAPPSHA